MKLIGLLIHFLTAQVVLVSFGSPLIFLVKKPQARHTTNPCKYYYLAVRSILWSGWLQASWMWTCLSYTCVWKEMQGAEPSLGGKETFQHQCIPSKLWSTWHHGRGLQEWPCRSFFHNLWGNFDSVFDVWHVFCQGCQNESKFLIVLWNVQT